MESRVTIKNNYHSINPIRLGVGQFDHPRWKKNFIFKWLKLRLCVLMTFTGNMRDRFWPNLGAISTFFKFLQMFKVNMRPKKRPKIDFSNFENSYQKTVEVIVKGV